MANLEKFTRYRDNPTLKEPGTSPVATSIEQLEKMTLEERQRVVASIEVLTKYSAKLKDEVTKLAGQLSSVDLDKFKSGLEDSLAGRIDEVVKKIGLEDRSLDIKNLWFGIQLHGSEIRWEKPNWNKPYKVDIYVSNENNTELASATLQDTVESPKDYYILPDNLEGKYAFVRARDEETGEYGNFSPVLRIENKETRLAKFLEYIQGKIKATALDEKLIAALKRDINQATQQQIEEELGRVRSEVETTKGQIQSTINAVRESSEHSWSQLRDTVLRNGTNISDIQRKAEGLAEEIKTVSAKANNAVAGVENINTVIAEKDSAIRREISNAITQVESTRTEVKRELNQTATNLESKLTTERDARTQLGNNLARTTEKVDQLATESDALKRKTSQIETDVSGNKTKTQQLEENISNLDSSTTKKLESMKSSFNNDHFYNYNMAGGTDGWMLEDFNQDITAKINTDVGPEDLRYPNVLTSIVNTGNIFVKSTQVTPIEREKTYRLTATFKTRSTRANLKEANLYFLPFDKNGNKHRPQDGLLNRQGGAKYPLIQAKTEVQPNGWVTLTGEISTWSSSYPITTAAEANMIPTPTVFACPALELVGKQGAGSFEVDIAVLDLKDISDEKSVTSQIDTVKRTLSDENKALAQQFTTQTSQFKSDVTAQMTQLSKSLTDAQKASNTRIDDIGTRLGASESKIQSLEQTVNDEKSSNALKIDTLRADFNKSKANQIDFDLDKTPTFEVQPQTKFRIIDKSAAALISRDFVTTYPANKYLKFWGNLLEFKQNNRLPVKSGDKLYTCLEVFSKTHTGSAFIKFSDAEGNQAGNLVKIGQVNRNALTKIESGNNLVVPNDSRIKFVELRFFTGQNTLSEENDPVLISNPQLRHYDETAIKSDAKLNDLKVTVGSEIQSYAERTQGIEAELNGRLAQNNIKQTARAEADIVSVEKTSELKVQIDSRLSADQNNLLSFTDTMRWNLNKARDETQPQTIEDNAATLRGDTASWKHVVQHSKEGSKLNDLLASSALCQVQYGLPYTLIFEGRSNIAGNVIQPHIRLNYTGSDGTVSFRNSNVPSVPLVDEWRTYQVQLTSPELQANETRSHISVYFEMKSTGTIQVRNPRLFYDAKTAIERINASIIETKQLAVDTSGKVRAKIGLKVNANGKAVGWSSEVNGDTNNFSINADNFKIANGADDYTPFSINTANKKIRFNGEVEFTRGNNLLINSTLTSSFDYPIGQYDGNFPHKSSVTGWSMNTAQYLNFRIKGSGWIPNISLYPNEIAVSIQNTDRSAKPEDRTGWFFQDLAVTPNTWYIFSGYIAAHRSKCRLRVEKILQDGSFVSSYGTTQFSTKTGGNNLSNYDRAFIKFKATSENVRVGLEMRNLPNTNINADQFAWLFRPMLEECSENATEPSAFVPSSVGTVIDGSTVRTSNLVLQPGENMLINAGFKHTPAMPEKTRRVGAWRTSKNYILGWNWWDREGSIGIARNRDRNWYGDYDNVRSPNTMYIQGEGDRNRSDVWNGWFSQVVKVIPGKRYIVSAYTSVHRASGIIAIENYSNPWDYHSYNAEILCNGNGDNQIYGRGESARSYGSFTAVTDYVCIAFTLKKTANDPYFFFYRPMLEEAKPNQTEPSPWVPGPMSMIDVQGNAVFDSVSVMEGVFGRLTAGEISLGTAHKLYENGAVKEWWTGGGTGTHLSSDGVIRTNAIEIRGGWAWDPINVDGKFIVKPSGLVEIWGDDRDNGIVLDAQNRLIQVLENGVSKVKLGKLN